MINLFFNFDEDEAGDEAKEKTDEATVSKATYASLLVKNFFFYEGEYPYCGQPIELTFAIHE